jgi:hypothetical protein
MSNLKAVYDRGVENLQHAYRSAVADFHLAQSSGDTDLAAEAAVRMASVEATAREFHSLASRAAAPQGGAAAIDRYGLNETEREVAKSWTNDANISEDQRLRTYAEQKQRYQHQRATGQYRDDQGTVRR